MDLVLKNARLHDSAAYVDIDITNGRVVAVESDITAEAERIDLLAHFLEHGLLENALNGRRDFVLQLARETSEFIP